MCVLVDAFAASLSFVASLPPLPFLLCRRRSAGHSVVLVMVVAVEVAVGEKPVSPKMPAAGPL